MKKLPWIFGLLLASSFYALPSNAQMATCMPAKDAFVELKKQNWEPIVAGLLSNAGETVVPKGKGLLVVWTDGAGMLITVEHADTQILCFAFKASDAEVIK